MIALAVPPAKHGVTGEFHPGCPDCSTGVRAGQGPQRRDVDRRSWPVLSRCACGGPNDEVVEVIRYTDKLGYDRKVYRLSRHAVFIGEYKTPEELAKVVDLATLVEDEDGSG